MAWISRIYLVTESLEVLEYLGGRRGRRGSIFISALSFLQLWRLPQRGNVTQTSVLETVYLRFSSEFHKTHLSPQGKTQENRMPSFLGQLTHWILLPRAHALLSCALSAPASIPTSQHRIWAAALPQVAGCLLRTINNGKKNRRNAKHT